MDILGGIGKLFGGGLAKVAGTVFSGIESIDHTDKRLELASAFQQLIIALEQKGMELQAAIIKAEANGNWLQRSWRPILALSFGFCVVYSMFIAKAFNLPNTELPERFWDLLELMIGGYVVWRSGEKIVKELAPVLQNLKRK